MTTKKQTISVRTRKSPVSNTKVLKYNKSVKQKHGFYIHNVLLQIKNMMTDPYFGNKGNYEKKYAFGLIHANIEYDVKGILLKPDSEMTSNKSKTKLKSIINRLVDLIQKFREQSFKDYELHKDNIYEQYFYQNFQLDSIFYTYMDDFDKKFFLKKEAICINSQKQLQKIKSNIEDVIVEYFSELENVYH